MSEQPLAFDYAETGSGPALLFLPGSFGTGTGWKPVLAYLGEGYRMVTTSLLGYGATPDIRPDGNATMAQQIDLIDRIIDRIGMSPHVVGHSYGGKWAMFGACLWEKYACAVWSDPGIVFDESRGSINYQEPWYLGLDANTTRLPGLVRPESPRTGAYKTLIEHGHDLVDFQALMAPRPFLVSGGAEDPPKRWAALKPIMDVNNLLGAKNRVAMTNREKHDPNPESNEVIYRFFEWWLK